MERGEPKSHGDKAFLRRKLIVLLSVLLGTVSSWQIWLMLSGVASKGSVGGFAQSENPSDPQWCTSASLSLSARSHICKSPSAAYELWQKKGGYGRSRDGNPGLWLLDFAEVSPSPDKVIVSLGCNKGEDLISVLSLWDKAFWNIDRYIELWNKANKFQTHLTELSKRASSSSRSQVSSSINASTNDDSVQYSTPLGICVEANLLGVEAIEHVAHSMGFDKPHGGREHPWRVINAAVSNVSNQFMEFPVEPPGAWWSNTLWYKERKWWQLLGVVTGIRFGSDLGLHKVPVKTADELLPVDLYMPGHDLLIFIDINGQDALALFGLAKTLATGRVQYIEFEYDPRGDWNTRALSEVILFLDSFHYDCFWLMPDRLFRLTGCWDPRYDNRATTWVNVACLNRNDERWWPIVEQWSYDNWTRKHP